MKNHMNLIFDAVSENESFARVSVAAFLTGLDPSLEELGDVKTAVSEAVTNVIIHSGCEQVEIRAEIDNDLLTIEIIDTGVGIENIKKAMEPLFTTKADEERSGMGFSFMEAFMDTLFVDSRVGEGTRVHMTKRIRKPAFLREPVLQ